MSDQEAIDTAAKVGGGALLGSPFLLLFVKRFFRKADEERAALIAMNVKLEAKIEQLRERVEGGLGSHRNQLEAEKEARHQLALKVQDHETRLLMREGLGGEPRTNPGSKPSDAVLALRAEHRARIAREESGNGD